MSLFNDYERVDLYLSDAEHNDAAEQTCRCGEPFANFTGGRCESCWNAAGRPMPHFRHHDDHDP